MSSDSNLHLNSEMLERYSLGHLEDSECERVEEHLLLCGQCQDELAEVDSFIRDMKHACREVSRLPALERAGVLSRWLAGFAKLGSIPRPAMAAGFAAAVILLVAVPMMTRHAVSGPAVSVELAAMRGPESPGTVQVDSGHPLKLRLDAAELPSTVQYRVDVVNDSGRTIWSGAPQRDGPALVVDVLEPLTSGAYWVRLLNAAGNPVREYALKVK